MRVSALDPSALRQRLAEEGLCLKTGPFVTRIRSRIPSVVTGVALQYQDFSVLPPDTFCDFRCQIRAPRGLRRYYQPQVLFLADGRSVFKPLSYDQAYPMLEWGLNWCIANQTSHLLVFHAASVERGGRALILPAPPGSGKSTLCAALVSKGWRLLTDESTLLDMDTGLISGPTRPISLKNASIDIIQRFAPQACMGPRCRDTLKGTVAHLRPPAESARRAGEPATPRWLVFPRYRPNTPATLTPRPLSEAFMDLAAQAFNYGKIGRLAFHAIGDMIDQVEAYDFEYSRLDEAMQIFDELAA